MSDIKILEDQIQGLKEKLRSLRLQKEQFIKAKGMDEQAETLRAEAEKYRTEVRFMKDTVAELLGKKNVAMANAIDGLREKVDALLPAGSAVMEISEDGEVFIGWKNEGEDTIPYAGLSGGEKVCFDAALAYALGCSIIITEAAELDEENLLQTIAKYGEKNMQCIVSSCHEPKEVQTGFEVVRL